MLGWLEPGCPILLQSIDYAQQMFNDSNVKTPSVVVNAQGALPKDLIRMDNDILGDCATSKMPNTHTTPQPPNLASPP